MWVTTRKELTKGTTKFGFTRDGRAMTYREWIEQVQQPDFADHFIDLLRTAPYEGYFWEVRPIKRGQLDETFEFVLVDSSILPTISAETSAFQEYFQASEMVVSFPNLGHDAQLIVPTPQGKKYAHLAEFTRKASQEQQRKFWARVGKEFEAKLGNETKWLSTAGLGVYWLHVRVDSRPKYYRHQPYKFP